MSDFTVTKTAGAGPALTTATKVLLACGIVSSVLYVGGEVFASINWAGYSYMNQAVSELAAIGAPTRPLMLVVFSAYNALVVAFSVGVWMSAGPKRALRIAAVTLAVYALVGQATTMFSPMHLRGSAMAATDIGHILLTIVEVLSIVVFIAFGSGARGKGFRLYSVFTILIVIAAGVLTGALSTRMTAAAASTPWVGIAERANIYSLMLWILIFGVIQLRAKASEVLARPRPVSSRHEPVLPVMSGK